MLTRAFNKFTLHVPLPLREFERAFGIKCREGKKAWQSSSPSVQQLLDHLQRFTRSASSREKYLRHLRQFCRWCRLDPDELIRLSKMKVEALVQEFADRLAQKDLSKSYVNTVIKRLRTFFRVNGYVGRKELEIRGYFVPTRYRKVPEYIPTKIEIFAMADAAGSRRDRATVLMLWSTGLRVSTLCSLNYGDVVEELENGEPFVKVSIYPRMKERVADACKGLIPYYTFMCSEAGEALRSYLRERREKLGDITLGDPLFHSDWTLWTRHNRTQRRLGRRAIGLVVKRAARYAGVQQWQSTTPHCLRKAFESVLRSPTISGGRLDKGTQEFFMGHILPSTQDVYYDKTKVGFHRKEYSTLDFSRVEGTSRAKDKLIDIGQLERFLEDGWLFVAKVSNEKVIVRGHIN